jgi:type I restriction enzyme S subunit
MEKKQNKAPLVRFPEFKEDWKFINGNELFKTISNKDHNSDLPILAISQEFGAIPRELINYNISVTNKSVSSYKVIEVGDFIISLRSFEGGIEYSNYKGICSPAYIILRPTVTLERNFFKIHFKTYRYIQQLQSKLEGIRDGKMVSYKYFSEIKLPLPTLPEQQKIAHFFTTLDKKIDQLQEKKNALEHYKKGMMQKLFSQEIRFRDDNGKDYPDWEEKKLGDICEKISSGNSKNSNDGEFDLYGSTGLIGKCDEPTHNGYFLLIARVGANAGQINRIDGEFGVSDNTLVIHTKSNISFLYYLLLNFNLNRLIFGSGQPLITGGQLKGLKLYFPILIEQTKIANFLSKIDDKINAVNEQIDKTKTYKKGLLQKMFV